MILQKAALRSHVFFFWLLFCFLILSFFVFLTPALAQFGIKPDESGGQRSWFIYSLKPGASVTDKVVVLNLQDVGFPVEVYPVDANIDPIHQGFVPESRNHENTGVGKWIELFEKVNFLKSKENRVISFTLKVPENTPPGQYAGAFIIQAEDSEEGAMNSSGIRIKTRTGLRVYVTVEGQPGSPDSLQQSSGQVVQQSSQQQIFSSGLLQSSSQQEEAVKPELSVSEKSDIQTETRDVAGENFRQENIFSKVSSPPPDSLVFKEKPVSGKELSDRGLSDEILLFILVVIILLISVFIIRRNR